MRIPASAALLACSIAAAGAAGAQVEYWRTGGQGLSWTAQAQSQTGALEIDSGLQPLELAAGQNLISLLRASGQDFRNGQPVDFVAGGQPRAWSNDGFFNQLDGPLDLVDGDPMTSSGGVYKTARNQAGSEFFWDLGAPFPINRIRFYPAPNDVDSFIRAFEILINDGADYSDIRRPNYRRLRRVEVNAESTVDLEFAPLKGRFLQLRVLSKNAFNLAEFEVYGEGFVPVASYLSELHSFGRPVNFDRLQLHATRLSRGGSDASQASEGPRALVQVRTGADDTPLRFYRRDRDTGSQAEVSREEFEALPRRALFRVDPESGEVLEEVDRVQYVNLPSGEQGPARDYVQGDVREDVESWSQWSPALTIDATGPVDVPVDRPSPREFMQLRLFFDGDADHAIRIDSLRIGFAPGLVSEAVGEVALADDPQPAGGLLEVAGGIDTTFIYDIRTEFDGTDLDGYRGVRLEAFPPPAFERLEMGDPLVEVTDFEHRATAEGFEVTFPPVDRASNRPIRLFFRMQLLEHNTPVDAWLLGPPDIPPHPVAPGDAGEAVGTGVTHVFSRQTTPVVETRVEPSVITPNGDGLNDEARILVTLSQFSGDIDLGVEIYDLAGRRVSEVVSGPRSSGVHAGAWHGRDRLDRPVPPGLYLCRVSVESDARTFESAQLIGVAY